MATNSKKNGSVDNGETSAPTMVDIEALPLPAAIVRKEDSVVLVANSAIAGILGVPADQLIGQTTHQFYVDLADRDSIRAKLANSGSIVDRELNLQSANGDTFRALATGKAIQFGDVPANILMFSDVTAEYTAAQEAVRLREAVDEMSEGFILSDADDRVIYANRKYKALYPEIAHLIKPGVLLEELVRAMVNSGAVQEALGREDEYVRDRMDRGDSKNWEAREINRLDGISIRMVERELGDGSVVGVRTDITEARERERQLATSESWLREIFDFAAVGLVLIDENGLCAQANRKFREFVGTETAVDGNLFENFLATEDRPEYSANLGALDTGSISEFLMKSALFVDGESTLAVRMRVTNVVVEEGLPPYRLAVLSDFSKETAAADELRVSEARYKSLIEDQTGFVCRYRSNDGVITFANRALSEYFDLTPETMTGKAIWDFMPEQDREAARQYVLGKNNNPAVVTTEQRAVAPDGAIRWHEWTDRPIFDDEGNVREILAYGFDITQRRQAERELRISKAGLEQAQRIAHIGSWTTDLRTNTIVASAETYRILGIDSAKQKLSFEVFLGRVHPGDRDDVKRVWEEQVARADHLKTDHRIVWPHGEVRHVMSIQEPVLNSAGEQIGRQGILQDITERKLAEYALREREAQLAQAQETGRIGSWYQDLQTAKRLTNYSDQVYRILGIGKADLPRKSASFYAFVHPDDEESLRNLVEKKRMVAEEFSCDHRVVRPDGAIRHVFQRSVPVLDKDGVLIARRGIIQDVTAQKTAEIELRKSEERLRLITDNLPVGIAMTDRSLTFNFANAQYAAWMNLDQSEIVGRPVLDIIGEEEYAGMLPHATRALEGEHVTIDHQLFLAGQLRDLEVAYIPARAEDGVITGVYGLVHDITERKSIENALRENEAQLAQAQETGRIGSWYQELRTAERKITYSDHVHRILGIEKADFPGGTESFYASVHPDDEKELRRLIEQKRMIAEEYSCDHRIVRPDGTIRHVFQRSVPVLDKDGALIARRGIIQDVTPQKKAEIELRQSEERLRLIADNLPVGIALSDRNLVTVFANAQYATWAEMDQSEIVGRPVVEAIGAASFVKALPYATRALAGEQVTFEMQREFADDLRDLEVTFVPARANDGTVEGAYGLVNDITDRKRAERVLQESEAKLAQAQRIGKIGSWFYAVDDHSLEYSDEVYKILGVDRDTFEPTAESFAALLHPDDKASFYARFSGTPDPTLSIDEEQRIIRPDGELRHVFQRSEPVYDGNGVPVARRGIIQDVTQQKEAEAALRDSQAFTHAIADNLPVFIANVGRDCHYRYVNKQYQTFFGIPRHEIVGMHMRDLIGDEVFDSIGDILNRVLDGETLTLQGEIDLPAGRMRQLRTFVPDRTIDGTVRGFYIIVQDISEVSQLEEQLQRAQRMEAVGRLTGGVAHDFNNMLSVIIGNIDLAAEEVGPDAAIAPYLESAVGAATRSAELTQSLLAFSRKQTLKPEAVAPAMLMDRLVIMLRRVFDESISIETEGAPDLWNCRADSAQLEAAILNLSINARDAMDSGGALRISAENRLLTAPKDDNVGGLDAGDYVAISVADNGSGIPDDAVAQVFEPFFTTKEVGVGSGLGLSMVYGFVSQSGGHVTLDTEVGVGTTVTLLLPRDTGDGAASSSAAESDTILARGDGQHVLVVEDDTDVRAVVVSQLTGLGYKVAEAENAHAALGLLQTEAHFDLLFSDVVMPGSMNGVELIQAARELRPDLRVALTTGYSDDVIQRGGENFGDYVLVRKPYKRHELAAAIAQALGN